MMSVHKTTSLASVAALALGALLAVSGQEAAAASVNSSGIDGGCAGGIVEPFIFDDDGNVTGQRVGVIDVLNGASWEAEFATGDQAGACFFTLQNTSSSAFAATISVVTVDQGGTFVDDNFTPVYGFENGVDLFLPQFSSRDDGRVLAFPEGVGDSATLKFTIGRSSEVFFDWSWGNPFGLDKGTPKIAFSVTATPVPLPAAGLMLLGGLGGLGGLSALRRRKRTA